MDIPKGATQFAVFGMGRFGQSVVKSLAEFDVTVLACDKDEERLQEVVQYATHVAQVDAADEGALEKLGVGNFDVIVLAMGEDFQGSLMATMTAKELGAKYVIVKAYGRREKKIFTSVGADLVIVPEQEMGAKLAHRLVRPNILDALDNSQQYQITEMSPLEEWVGKSVEASAIRKKYKASLLAIIRAGQTIIPVMAEEVIQAQDVLVVLSDTQSEFF